MSTTGEDLAKGRCCLRWNLDLHLIVVVGQDFGIADNALFPVKVYTSSILRLGCMDRALDVDDYPWVQRWATTMLLVHGKVWNVQDLLLEHFFTCVSFPLEHGGDGIDSIISHPFAATGLASDHGAHSFGVWQYRVFCVHDSIHFLSAWSMHCCSLAPSHGHSGSPGPPQTAQLAM